MSLDTLEAIGSGCRGVAGVTSLSLGLEERRDERPRGGHARALTLGPGERRALHKPCVVRTRL